MSRRRRAALFAGFLGCGILFALCFWQIQRESWKSNLLAHIQAQMHAPPYDLSAWNGSTPLPDLNYRPVLVQGTWGTAEISLLSRVRQDEVGRHLLSTLTTPAGITWLVNRGFVSEADFTAGKFHHVSGTVTLHAIARTPLAQGWMQPANDLARQRWFFYQPQAVAASPAYVLESRETSTEPPFGAITIVDIPNNHRQYAFTWGALGVILAIFTSLFIRKVS